MMPLRAYTFIGLNIVRALSIIAILLVFASNVVTLADDIKAVNSFVAAGNVIGDSRSGSSTTNSTSSFNDFDYITGSTVPNQTAGPFWAILNRLLILGQTIILLLSELGWPSSFFNRFFPVLGDEFGLGALGIMQGLISAAILSHHVSTFTLVSAFFLFSIGCLNMFVGLIFRHHAKSKRSVTSWREHGKSVLPTHVAGVDVRPAMSAASNITPIASMFTGGSADTKHSNGSMPSKSGLGFGRQGEKAAALGGYLISKPIESLPRYAAK